MMQGKQPFYLSSSYKPPRIANHELRRSRKLRARLISNCPYSEDKDTERSDDGPPLLSRATSPAPRRPVSLSNFPAELRQKIFSHAIRAREEFPCTALDFKVVYTLLRVNKETCADLAPILRKAVKRTLASLKSAYPFQRHLWEPDILIGKGSGCAAYMFVYKPLKTIFEKYVFVCLCWDLNEVLRVVVPAVALAMAQIPAESNLLNPDDAFMEFWHRALDGWTPPVDAYMHTTDLESFTTLIQIKLDDQSAEHHRPSRWFTAIDMIPIDWSRIGGDLHEKWPITRVSRSRSFEHLRHDTGYKWDVEQGKLRNMSINSNGKRHWSSNVEEISIESLEGVHPMTKRRRSNNEGNWKPILARPNSTGRNSFTFRAPAVRTRIHLKTSFVRIREHMRLTRRPFQEKRKPRMGKQWRAVKLRKTVQDRSWVKYTPPQLVFASSAQSTPSPSELFQVKPRKLATPVRRDVYSSSATSKWHWKAIYLETATAKDRDLPTMFAAMAMGSVPQWAPAVIRTDDGEVSLLSLLQQMRR